MMRPLMRGVNRVAWDFILIEERAVLLEGNSGWGGLVICQRLGYNFKLNQDRIATR